MGNVVPIFSVSAVVDGAQAGKETTTNAKIKQILPTNAINLLLPIISSLEFYLV